MRRLRPVAAALSLTACGAADTGSAADVELPSGARVQFESATSRGSRVGIVGTVGECTAIMVPDSWSAAERFDVVRIGDVRALRVSTRYDGRPGDDGAPRITPIPPDTAGEGWRELPIDAVRERYGACEPGF